MTADMMQLHLYGRALVRARRHRRVIVMLAEGEIGWLNASTSWSTELTRLLSRVEGWRYSLT